MQGYWEGRGESGTKKKIQLISPINPSYNILIQLHAKHENIHNTLIQRFGDPKTFQIESKTGVGMIPTSFRTTI